MEDKNSIKSVKKFFDNDKIRNFIIIAGIVGIALIFLSSYIDFGSLSGKKKEAIARINNQMPLSEKEKRATYVVANTGTIDDLEKKLSDLLQEIGR